MASRSARSLVRFLVLLAVGAGVVWFIFIGYDVASSWETGRRVEAALVEAADGNDGGTTTMSRALESQFLSTGLEAVYPVCPYVPEVQVRAALLPDWDYEGGDGPDSEGGRGTLLLLYSDGTVSPAAWIDPSIDLCTGADPNAVVAADTPWRIEAVGSSGDSWVFRPAQ